MRLLEGMLRALKAAAKDFVSKPFDLAEVLIRVPPTINLAHALKLKVVAGGVETEEQSRLLRLLNCDETQGYLFSKPIPAQTFETGFPTPPAAG